MVGIKGGLYSNDPETAWNIDSVLEAVEDNMVHYGKYLVPQIFQGGKADQAAVDSLCTFLDNICKLVERRLNAHGCAYITGEKPSVADCKVIASFYCCVYNNDMPMGDDHRKQGLDCIAKYPKAKQYFEQTVNKCLGTYLSSRPKMSY